MNVIEVTHKSDDLSYFGPGSVWGTGSVHTVVQDTEESKASIPQTDNGRIVPRG